MSLLNNQENNLVVNNLSFSTSLETKSDHIIKHLKEVPTQQPRDIYKAVSDHPYSPVALGVSISLVIAAIGGVIKIWKSDPQELKYLGECISTVIHAVADFVQILKSQNKGDQNKDNQ